MRVNYHILKNTIVVNFAGKAVNVDRNSELGKNVIAKIKAGDLDDIPVMVNTAERIKHMSNELFVLEDGVLYSYGVEVPNFIADRVLEFMEEELPFEYLINFWNNLKENPSDNSKLQLFGFLEANHFAITPDGHFIAYKKVRDDYLDDYTGKIDNSPGQIVEMPREDVVDDPSRSCSRGLHIAPFSYAKTYKYGGKLIELKVNPRDVVSVPTSYEHQKARVCKYLVIGDAERALTETVVEGDKFDAPVDVIDEGCAPGFIDPNAEMELLTEDDIKEVETAVKTESAPVIKKLKLGNFKYEVSTISDVDFDRIKSLLTPRKKSRWAKAFVDTWKNDIATIERMFNDVIDKFEYIITLKNGSRFYAYVK